MEQDDFHEFVSGGLENYWSPEQIAGRLRRKHPVPAAPRFKNLGYPVDSSRRVPLVCEKRMGTQLTSLFSFFCPENRELSPSSNKQPT